jgi:uncharacterized BrkB/YihY/UPF0761 family membrane protein
MRTFKDFLEDERGIAFEWLIGLITLLVCGLFLAVFIEFVTEFLDPIAIDLGLPVDDATRVMLLRYWVLLPWLLTFGVVYWWYNRAQKESDVGFRV